MKDRFYSDSIVPEIFKGIPLNEKQTSLIESKFHLVKLEKGEILLNVGATVRHQYFVDTGCLRTYFLDNSGKEYTIQFAIHDWWISDYTAFFTSKKAVLRIECIQDATIYKVSKKDMDDLYIQIPQLETFFRKKMESAFSSFQKRILEGLSLSAKARYSSFIRSYPNIEQNVKNYHIASYLGITTESLSRIRKELNQN